MTSHAIQEVFSKGSFRILYKSTSLSFSLTQDFGINRTPQPLLVQQQAVL